METYAFSYGLEKKISSILKRNKTDEPKKIQIKEMFDMISGTSTGSILAAALAV